MKIYPNDPANPSIESVNHLNGVVEIRTNDFGLSIRAEFAARAMQGYISAGSTGMPPAKDIARFAVETADALITELNKEVDNETTNNRI